MSTVRDVCTSALRRLRVLAAAETMTAEDAALALGILNSLMAGWATQGVDIAHQAFALDDTFRFFVPHKLVTGETLAALDYKGTWNATTNVPALTSSAGTQGNLYKVAVAGSTTLDGVASWSVGDYLVFNGDIWLRGKSADRFESPVIDLLAMDMVDEFGKAQTPGLQRDANDAWIGLQAEFVRVDAAGFDAALIRVPSRRYYGVLEG
jgi:hypothetical protein